MLNPFAADFKPAGEGDRTSAAIPIRASPGAAARPPTIMTSARQSCDLDAPTPSGPGEVAQHMSGDMRFEDFFEQGSRQNSVGAPAALAHPDT
jgi:hypothetical protein